MKHIEDNIQIACVRWFKYSYPKHLIHHSPNGGKRNAIEGARFKQMGTLAGFPDLFVPCSNGFHSGLFVEMKSPKGTTTESQKEVSQELIKYGYKYEVCRSLDEFIKTVTDYFNHKPLTNNV